MDGMVVIDKPAGMTSHDVVSGVKRLLGCAKAGHTGTLDPMATGVLPVCINEATKLAPYLTAEDKTYLATLLLGVQTDTLDTEGTVLQTSDRVVDDEAIRDVLGRLVGKIKQTPPAYSALKHQGKPLYVYARRGEFPERTAREVEIFSLAIHRIDFPRVTFEVTCSKGTYIRSLCADAGEALGIGGCLSGLRRLRSGMFTEAMAVSWTKEGGAVKEERQKTLSASLIPMMDALPGFVNVPVSRESAARLRNGYQPDIGMLCDDVLPSLAQGDMIKISDPDGHLVALAQTMLPSEDWTNHESRHQAAKTMRIISRTP